MKKALVFLAVALTFGLAALEADAAKRFGGGSSIGKQRPAPTMKEAPKTAPAQAQPSQAAPAATPATPATPPAKPSFMSKWGGVLAGLGIGALLGSLFSGGLGGFGTLLVALLAGLVIFAVVRMLLARKATAAGPVQLAGAGADAPAPGPARFEGIGSRVPGSESQPSTAGTPLTAAESGATVAPQAAVLPPGFEKEPFLRVAKTSFIRLQAANDAKDLDDIRDYTTPEMFAELSMQIRERGDEPQKTEVVSIESQLVEAVVEDGYEIASVRFYGLIRENAAANPEPFDEVWHVRKKAGDRKATWLIAGIQQSA